MAEPSPLFTVVLECGQPDNLEDKRRLDAFTQGVVADLNTMEAVRATTVHADAAAPDEKAGLGSLLLGALTAEVKGESAAVKLLRYLCSRLAEQPQPAKLKVSRKWADGEELIFEWEGSDGQREPIEQLLERVIAALQPRS
ncbi:MAG: hypothetical protein VKO44_11710 [Cyanobacteriota bacterium]|nr:hypothetical protein [Cyanobacteriota bacterium]